MIHDTGKTRLDILYWIWFTNENKDYSFKFLPLTKHPYLPNLSIPSTNKTPILPNQTVSPLGLRASEFASPGPALTLAICLTPLHGTAIHRLGSRSDHTLDISSRCSHPQTGSPLWKSLHGAAIHRLGPQSDHTLDFSSRCSYPQTGSPLWTSLHGAAIQRLGSQSNHTLDISSRCSYPQTWFPLWPSLHGAVPQIWFPLWLRWTSLHSAVIHRLDPHSAIHWTSLYDCSYPQTESPV